jgi:hypothetical protein
MTAEILRESNELPQAIRSQVLFAILKSIFLLIPSIAHPALVGESSPIAVKARNYISVCAFYRLQTEDFSELLQRNAFFLGRDILFGHVLSDIALIDKEYNS